MHRRWFVLRGSTLTYYSKERRNSALPPEKHATEKTKSSKPQKKGVISLHSLRVERYEHHSRPFVFTLTHPINKARVYFMSCDNEEERVQWMGLLQVCCCATNRMSLDCTSSLSHCNAADCFKPSVSSSCSPCKPAPYQARSWKWCSSRPGRCLFLDMLVISLTVAFAV